MTRHGTRTGARRSAAAVALVAAVAVTSVVWPARAGAASGGGGSTRRITVVGTGQVKGTPDVADVNIGVSARGRTAVEALDTANDRAAKVIAALKEGGVADDDLQTSGLSIQPVWDRNTITGYEVSNTVQARLRDLAKAGALLDATARVAGDEIRLHGIGFTIDDDSTLLAQARNRAVKRARAQAEQLADAAGVDIVEVLSIDEGAFAIPYQSRSFGEQAADGASIPIEPGSQTLSVQVTVVYAIR